MTALYLRELADRLTVSEGLMPEAALLPATLGRDAALRFSPAELAVLEVAALRPGSWSARAEPSGRIHVFAATEESGAFGFHQALDAELTHEEFVASAYRGVMGRQADPAGAETYLGHLHGGTLTRMAALETLADSDEARDRGRRHLLVAATSRLAAEIGAREARPLRDVQIRIAEEPAS